MKKNIAINPCDFARWIQRQKIGWNIKGFWHYGHEALREENEKFTDEEMIKFYLQDKATPTKL